MKFFNRHFLRHALFLRSRLIAAMLFVLAAAITTASVTATAPAFAEPYSVYIFTGQSNALGTTRFEGDTAAQYGPGSAAADRAAGLFWSNVKSSNKTYPAEQVGDSGGAIKAVQMQQGGWENPAYWGPEIGFARAMVGLGHEKLLVIKACRGGGGNTLWDKATYRKDADAGHMWGHLADTVDAALSALAAQGQRFEVKGLVYLQGESNTPQEAAAADQRLAALAANLKGHIDATHRGTASGMRVLVGEIAGSDANPSRRLTTARHQRLAERRKDIAFVQTRDLPVKQDRTHFGRDAKLQIGYRMATVMHGLLHQDDPIAWTGQAKTPLWYEGHNWRGLANPWPQSDYRVEGAKLLSFDSDNEVFTGRSLTLSKGATLAWQRHNHGDFKTLTHRFDQLALHDATLCPGSSRNSVRHVFHGKMTLRGDNTFDMNGAGRYTVYLRIGGEDEDDQATLAGDGTLHIERGQTGTQRTVELFADASGFSGGISLQGLKGKPLALHVHDTSGWGTGALQAGPHTEVALLADKGVDAQAASLLLDTNASLTLGPGRHTLGALAIDDQTVPPGDYVAEDLDRLGFGAAFSGKGSVTITRDASDTPRIAAPDTDQDRDALGP